MMTGPWPPQLKRCTACGHVCRADQIEWARTLRGVRGTPGESEPDEWARQCPNCDAAGTMIDEMADDAAD